MTYARVGAGLTVLFGVLCGLVQASGRQDWWGGPAIAGVMVALYWALGRELFPGRENGR